MKLFDTNFSLKVYIVHIHKYMYLILTTFFKIRDHDHAGLHQCHKFQYIKNILTTKFYA